MHLAFIMINAYKSDAFLGSLETLNKMRQKFFQGFVSKVHMHYCKKFVHVCTEAKIRVHACTIDQKNVCTGSKNCSQCTKKACLKSEQLNFIRH